MTYPADSYSNLHLVALAARVLAVAIDYQDGRWRAYIDAVPGHDHQTEYLPVVNQGSTLNERLARAAFPRLTGPYTR